MPGLIEGTGLVAVVLLVAALASGVVERAPLSFPMIFLGIGFLLGEGGLAVLEIDLQSPILIAVATISLALVLFLDAVNLNLEEIRSDWYVPFMTMIPGTLLIIGGIALVAYTLLGLDFTQSLLLGAILASTDAVVLRDVVRDERIPRSIRRALSVEAGMNDIVTLPIVLILIAVANAQLDGWQDWVSFIGRILVLSPLVGIIIGGVGARLMQAADNRLKIQLEYQALYGIGLVLAAFFAGTMVNGDGFLAAFFAGLGVTLFNSTLCDCFLDYGEVTSEMLMMLAFIFFGAVLSTMITTVDLVSVTILALIGLIIVRPIALRIVLVGAKMSPTARLFIGWFGPRGLGSLLLALLVVQGGIPGADNLLAITGVVVLISVLLHGSSATPLGGWYGKKVAESEITFAEERESTFLGLFEGAPDDIVRVEPSELFTMLQSDDPPIVLDVRARAHYDREDTQIPNSVRVLPDMVVEWANDQTPPKVIVTYCECPNEGASGRVSRTLIEMGFDARALRGGWLAWRDDYPIESKNNMISLDSIAS